MAASFVQSVGARDRIHRNRSVEQWEGGHEKPGAQQRPGGELTVTPALHFSGRMYLFPVLLRSSSACTMQYI